MFRYSPLCFMITGASAEVFGSVLGRTSEQQLDRDSLPGTKFGASEEPQHTTHTQDARRHGNTHVHTFTHTHKWGGNSGSSSRWRNYFGHVDHGSHTRLRVLKPVRHWSKGREWKILTILYGEEQAFLFLASFFHVYLAKHYEIIDYVIMSMSFGLVHQAKKKFWWQLS